LSLFSAFKWRVPSEDRKNLSLEQEMQNKAYNATEYYLMSMRNLFLHSTANVFVGTRQSNWCRRIDELQRGCGNGGTYYVDAHGHLEDSGAYADINFRSMVNGTSVLF
jgi:hypothetical protein